VPSGAPAGRPPERGARTLMALRLARVMTSTCSGAMSQNWWSRSGSPTAATMDAGASAAQRSRKSAPHLRAGARQLCARRAAGARRRRARGRWMLSAWQQSVRPRCTSAGGASQCWRGRRGRRAAGLAVQPVRAPRRLAARRGSAHRTLDMSALMLLVAWKELPYCIPIQESMVMENACASRTAVSGARRQPQQAPRLAQKRGAPAATRT